MRLPGLGRARQQIWVIQGWALEGLAAASEDLNAEFGGARRVDRGEASFNTGVNGAQGAAVRPVCTNLSVEGFRRLDERGRGRLAGKSGERRSSVTWGRSTES